MMGRQHFILLCKIALFTGLLTHCNVPANQTPAAIPPRPVTGAAPVAPAAAPATGAVAATTTPSITYNVDGQSYVKAEDALIAGNRFRESQLALVTPVTTTTPGRLLIVLPDKARIKVMEAAQLSTFSLLLKNVAANPFDAVVDYSTTELYENQHTYVRAIDKMRVFTTATAEDRNNTIAPDVRGYDYLLWFEVKATKPDNSAWIGKWLIKKTSTVQQEELHFDPQAVAQNRGMSDWLYAVQVATAKLNGTAPPPAPTVVAQSNIAKPYGVSITIPAKTQPGQQPGLQARSSSGSGIVVTADGFIVTNAHVVNACKETKVTGPSGDIDIATVQAQDVQNDLALLKVSRSWPSVAHFRSGASIRQGENVVVLGFPLSTILAKQVNVTSGTISALAGLQNDTRQYQVTAPVQQGNSGGPLVDMSGHLIGVVSSKLNALALANRTGDIPQNINFAIKENVVKDFLDSNGVHYTSSPSTHTLSSPDVADIGRQFTVSIECTR